MANHSGFMRRAGATKADIDGVAQAIRASGTYAHAMAGATADEVLQHIADTLDELADIAACHAAKVG